MTNRRRRGGTGNSRIQPKGLIAQPIGVTDYKVPSVSCDRAPDLAVSPWMRGAGLANLSRDNVIEMSLAETVIQELEQEGKTTRRVLDRVPADKLAWKPHEKSLSLGQLALHLARLNGGIAPMGVPDTFELVGNPFQFAEAESKTQIINTFDDGLAQAKKVIAAMDDATITGTWAMKIGDRTIMTMPRIALFRALLCNHAYHHRGQLSVYLRLLDVDVPSIYGPSADENPFAAG